MKLLVLDLEGTIFQTHVRLPGTKIDSTIWQGIANALGPEAIREEVETHKRWENGEYPNYIAWMEDTIAIHKRHHLSKKLFDQLIMSAQYNPGVVETLGRVDRKEYELIIVSGGFRELAARAQKDIGIFHAFAACEYLFGPDERLQACNLLPCDFEGKTAFINLMLRDYGLGRKDWLFIGDGPNDVPVVKQAPVSIGYRAHPELRRNVTYNIEDFPQLLTILDQERSKQSA